MNRHFRYGLSLEPIQTRGRPAERPKFREELGSPSNMGVKSVAIDRHRGAVWQNLRKNPASSLPAQAAGMYGAEREVILVITYVVVTFSILVQGLTIGTLTRRWLATPVLVPRAEQVD